MAKIKSLLIQFRRMLEIPLLYKNWTCVVLNRFGLCSLKQAILWNGLKFNVSGSRARSIVSFVFSKESYNRFRKIKDGDIVIDIGAFIGDFSIKSANAGKKVKVYAYEPCKKTFKTLKQNIKLNNFKKQIIPFNLGIYSKKGKKKLHIHKWEGINSMYECDWLENESKTIGSETIKLITFQQIFKNNKINYCDFLKIDCEGVEYDIVTAIPKKYLEKIKYIAMESTDYENTGKKNYKLVKHLEKNSFLVQHIDKKNGNIMMIYAENKNFNKK